MAPQLTHYAGNNDSTRVLVELPEGCFEFHSQWLHDARCDDGASRNAATALCQQPVETISIISVGSSGLDCTKETLDISWDNGNSSKIPVEWLRVMAPIVASRAGDEVPRIMLQSDEGWEVQDLIIPQLSYKKLFDPHLSQKELDNLTLSVIDNLLSPLPGLIKVVDMPEPNMQNELNNVNNLNTIVLKKLFGSVFVHPIRGKDKTFRVSSHDAGTERVQGLPNYDATETLLPHTDHTFYHTPAQVQGWYCLEGESENTFVSVPAALVTLREEDAKAYDLLCDTPLAFGRRNAFYGDPAFNATVDTAITKHVGSGQEFKRARWHPNLIGSLLCPFEKYEAARLAHIKFQEILRRPTHQLIVKLKPGDYYIWDNFRILHGRERVLETPRTGIGQTVPEQIVQDKYRSLCIGMLKDSIDEKWLVHLPMPQLRELIYIVREKR